MFAAEFFGYGLDVLQHDLESLQLSLFLGGLFLEGDIYGFELLSFVE